MEKKEYRPDIDVLRAIAVLAVVFYHAHIPYFQGGYIGVSIFFVISGYLITGIIKRKLESNSFNFLEFYENRIRRILPALLFLVICLTLFTWYTSVSTPELRQLFSSVKRVLLTIPNIYFYQNTNYFDPAAETLPLLHTWSLGVEEQFYFVMPALLFFLYKILKGKIQIIHILWGLCILSFVSSLILIQYNQKFTFYMLPTRAWELLMGSILAYTNWTPKSQKNKLLCRVIGLILISYPIIFYGNILFPGIWALPPCLGACLYIAGGTQYIYIYRRSLLNTMLYNKLFIFIGLISYSVYLWHWPIFVYYQNFPFRREMSLEMGLTLSFLTLIIASFSWKFIENPIRHSLFFKKRFIVWSFALVGVGSTLFFVGNFAYPYQSEKLQEIIIDNPETATDYYNKNTDHLNFIYLGDSHAFMMHHLYVALAKKYQLSTRLIDLPLKNSYNQNQNIAEQKIREKKANELTKLYQTTKIDYIFIMYRYSYHIYGQDIVRPNSIINPLTYTKKHNVFMYDALYYSLKDTINEALSHNVKHIFIQYPIPEPQGFIQESAGKLQSFFGYNEDEINKALSESFTNYHLRNDQTIAVLKRIKNEYKDFVTLLNLNNYLLNKDKKYYLVLENNYALYRDDDHLSKTGVMKFMPYFDNLFQELFVTQKQTTN